MKTEKYLLVGAILALLCSSCGNTSQKEAKNIQETMAFVTTDTTVKVLSPAYRVLDKSIPLHKSIAVTFTVPVDKALQRRTTMASIASDGSLSYVGGKYADGALTVKTSTLGTYCLAADVTPPDIQPLFKDGEDCRGRSTLTFRISDNFSGIDSYTASIDGRWVAVDYSPKQARATIYLDAEGISGGTSHEVSFTLTDSCGNRTVWQGSITK